MKSPVEGPGETHWGCHALWTSPTRSTEQHWQLEGSVLLGLTQAGLMSLSHKAPQSTSSISGEPLLPVVG